MRDLDFAARIRSCRGRNARARKGIHLAASYSGTCSGACRASPDDHALDGGIGGTRGAQHVRKLVLQLLRLRAQNVTSPAKTTRVYKECVNVVTVIIATIIRFLIKQKIRSIQNQKQITLISNFFVGYSTKKKVQTRDWPTKSDRLHHFIETCLHHAEFGVCVAVVPQHGGALLFHVRPVRVHLIGQQINTRGVDWSVLTSKQA